MLGVFEGRKPTTYYLATWRTLPVSAAIVGRAVLVAIGAHRAIFALAKRGVRHKAGHLIESIVRHEHAPSQLILPLVAVLATLPWLAFTTTTAAKVSHAVVLILISALGWLAIGVLNAFEDFISRRYAIEASDSLAARQMRTQVQVLRHIAVVVVVVVTLATMLMTFPNIRHIGESLFASAGLAAVVAGLAARTALTNLLAGVQIALTQPIRLEDAVVVEGESGWIEQITTTYVVVRIWDLRRLVVPLTYFIEKPFQNWTRRTADLLGTVFVYTDYSVPVDDVRRELHEILQRSGLWDGKVWSLQVTNTSDRAMELRALMSAPNGSKAWELRCHVREKLIQYLQHNYPESLPRTRTELAAGVANAELRPTNGEDASKVA
jgi:small-conductance mechanosensitive channel